ncbi:hypothetical protein MCOR27_005522 [Pyricularia oryzae]|uniref:Secondary alcohol dehydrogenase n=1 Tax=Pyricularia grisea TaxID=148305 RepID=A0ABQ8NH13_PYRGI|nr:hypothetical protein MCOR01_011111 [Pyricularia oryzae]KAI6296966.1 hypothetical protein MCOR33_006590 [Pyricularia grisea]KAI6257278.1 hypothetical protein MCOR19_006281 [Pyricularia oryzae]KAI6278071.1 hypothetical protein MCOR26_004790 [Pyricularia oryzae]KAI6278634.1 hypothetical protein MCOR27_005522 [Pyricularia oryzae]
MSSETLPISPARFAEAIKELSLAGLHLKVLEIRNSIAHLDYSNEQLRPFAEGKEPVHGGDGTAQPDQDCIDAIKENEGVIERMQERIRLVRVEVEENRGCSWTEFESAEERGQRGGQTTESAVPGSNAELATNNTTTSTVNGQGTTDDRFSGLSEAWRDGTIQMGTIRNGQIHMDTLPASASSGGGRLTDEQLRQALEERMREAEEDEQNDVNGGLHL